jgi:outer membrane protein OmpA-like peptidoglycan-associated protein
MFVSKRLTGAAVAAALLTTTACVTNPETGEQDFQTRTAVGALAGAVAGYFGGDLIGGRRDRTEKAVGAGVGAIAGAAIGQYMDRQERELRARTQGTGVVVERQGDELLLSVPAGITFPINSAEIQPQFYDTLSQVSQTLSAYPATLIDVYGHTDPSGGDRINIPLSQNRAQSVASYLSRQGVNPARIATQGFGSSRPVADNGTEAGRAQNRRVEIRIVPNSSQG